MIDFLISIIGLIVLCIAMGVIITWPLVAIMYVAQSNLWKGMQYLVRYETLPDHEARHVFGLGIVLGVSVGSIVWVVWG